MVSTVEAWVRKNLGKLQKYYFRLPVWLQNIIVSSRGAILSSIRYPPVAWRMLDELKKHDEFSRDELRSYQMRLLRTYLQEVSRISDFWKFFFKEKGININDIRTLDDFYSLKFLLTRDMVRDNLEKIVNRSLEKRNRLEFHTSGTTGSGLKVVSNKYSNMAFWIHQQRQYLWLGAGIRDWRISLFGAKVVPLEYSGSKIWRTNYFEHQYLISSFHVNKEHVDHYIDFFKKHPGLILEGFPTSLNILADLILEKGAICDMKFVITTGEPLTENIRNKIGQAFCCKVYSSYGMTEECGLILECDHGRMHQLADFGILEIVDDNGNPVPPGVEGDFLWTGFYQTAMPLIKYKIGDRGMWAVDQSCPCGRKYPIVEPTITRDSDYLIKKNGQYLTPRIINQYIKDKTAFKACQIVQETSTSICIRYVPGNGDHEAQAERLRSDLLSLLGKGYSISIIMADEPIVRESGKIPLIISKVN
jgi:phenylacetate-CoA ligase